MNDIEQVAELVEIFSQVSATNSPKEKTLIIHKNKDNELLLKVLKFLCDDQVVVGLSKAKIEKNVEVYTENAVSTLSQILDYVMANTTGTDVTIGMLQGYMSKFKDVEHRAFVSDLLTKRIKNGLSKKIVNAVYGKNTIKEMVFMKGDSFEKHEHKVKGAFYLSKKFDGNRMFVKAKPTVNGYDIQYLSKSGAQLEGFNYFNRDVTIMVNALDSTLPKSAEKKGWVFDGEALAKDDGTMTTNELYRRTQELFKIKGPKKGLIHNVYDIVPLDEFEKGKSKAKYSERREMIDWLFDNTNVEDAVPVEILYKGADKSQIKVWSDWADELGYEGIMLNLSDAFYECKRVSHLLKVKKFYYSDVLVTGVYEGDLKNAGKLGGVIIQFKDFDPSPKIGGGFTDKERVDFWKNPELIEGKIITVRYFEESYNKKEGKGLRFPSYKGIRADKGIEDISYES